MVGSHCIFWGQTSRGLKGREGVDGVAACCIFGQGAYVAQGAFVLCLDVRVE